MSEKCDVMQTIDPDFAESFDRASPETNRPQFCASADSVCHHPACTCVETMTDQSHTPNDLVERCRELLEWNSTGLLAGGKGGAVRAMAERLEPQVGDRYALSIAESQTKDEAMRAVVNSLPPLVKALEEIADTFDVHYIAGSKERRIGDLARAALSVYRGESK